MAIFSDSISSEEFAKITDRNMSEKALQAQCLEVLKVTGWRVSHVFEQTHYARRTDRGFPDICATKDGRVIFAELKREKGVLTGPQEYWLDDLAKNIGAEVYVVRPSTRQEFFECLAWERGPTKIDGIEWKGSEAE